MGVHGRHSLESQGPELVLLVAHLFDNEGQGLLRLSQQVLWVLARQAREQVVQRGEAGVDERGVLGGRGLAQTFEERRDASIGHGVLLDAGLDDGNILDLGIDGGVLLQDGQQALDLVVSESFGHDPRGWRIWQDLDVRGQNAVFFVV